MKELDIYKHMISEINKNKFAVVLENKCQITNSNIHKAIDQSESALEDIARHVQSDVVLINGLTCGRNIRTQVPDVPLYIGVEQYHEDYLRQAVLDSRHYKLTRRPGSKYDSIKRNLVPFVDSIIAFHHRGVSLHQLMGPNSKRDFRNIVKEMKTNNFYIKNYKKKLNSVKGVISELYFIELFNKNLEYPYTIYHSIYHSNNGNNPREIDILITCPIDSYKKAVSKLVMHLDKHDIRIKNK